MRDDVSSGFGPIHYMLQADLYRGGPLLGLPQAKWKTDVLAQVDVCVVKGLDGWWFGIRSPDERSAIHVPPGFEMQAFGNFTRGNYRKYGAPS